MTTTREKYVMWGALLGAAGGFWGEYFRAATGDVSSSTSQFLWLTATGFMGGAGTALVLFQTREARTRSIWHHYACWVLASSFGALVIMLPEIPADGMLAVGFAGFIGLCIGLPMAAIARQFTAAP